MENINSKESFMNFANLKNKSVFENKGAMSLPQTKENV